MLEIDRASQTLPPAARREKVRNIFSNYLKERRLRQTPERFAVLDAVYSSDDHFDADELVARLKDEHSGVSRATVYNTLDLLIDCKLVERHQFDAKQAKYERSYRYWQHDHLICLDCNHLYEFCDPRLHEIQEMVGRIYEMDVTHHSLNLYGRCKKEKCPHRGADNA